MPAMTPGIIPAGSKPPMGGMPAGKAAAAAVGAWLVAGGTPAAAGNMEDPCCCSITGGTAGVGAPATPAPGRGTVVAAAAAKGVAPAGCTGTMPGAAAIPMSAACTPL
jgi:hypothetical protein